MPDTKGYPRDKKGRNAYVSKCINVVKKENPNKSLDAIIGQCEGMWKSHWNKKKKSNASLTEEEFWAEFDWADCSECVELSHKLGEFEVDIPNKSVK